MYVLNAKLTPTAQLKLQIKYVLSIDAYHAQIRHALHPRNVMPPEHNASIVLRMLIVLEPRYAMQPENARLEIMPIVEQLLVVKDLILMLQIIDAIVRAKTVVPQPILIMLSELYAIHRSLFQNVFNVPMLNAELCLTHPLQHVTVVHLVLVPVIVNVHLGQQNQFVQLPQFLDHASHVMIQIVDKIIMEKISVSVVNASLVKRIPIAPTIQEYVMLEQVPLL
jgi:hypothetical protein